MRAENVLIIGSGNLVHNLHAYAWGRHMPTPYEWAGRFEEEAKAIMLEGESKALIDYEGLGKDAMLSIPTPDHYLPLLYVLGARQDGDAVTFPVEGIDGGSISMLTVRIDSAEHPERGMKVALLEATGFVGEALSKKHSKGGTRSRRLSVIPRNSSKEKGWLQEPATFLTRLRLRN